MNGFRWFKFGPKKNSPHSLEQTQTGTKMRPCGKCPPLWLCRCRAATRSWQSLPCSKHSTAQHNTAREDHKKFALPHNQSYLIPGNDSKWRATSTVKHSKSYNATWDAVPIMELGSIHRTPQSPLQQHTKKTNTKVAAAPTTEPRRNQVLALI